jgi:hypothetical protein
MQQEETHTAPSAFIPSTSILSTSVDDAFLYAEGKLREVRQMLLDARPESVDRCQSELQQVVAVLERLVSDGALQTNPSVSSALLRIRRSAHALGLQIEYASNLCFGWIQLRLSTGYTAQGLPVLRASEPGSTFEG